LTSSHRGYFVFSFLFLALGTYTPEGIKNNNTNNINNNNNNMIVIIIVISIISIIIIIVIEWKVEGRHGDV